MSASRASRAPLPWAKVGAFTLCASFANFSGQTVSIGVAKADGSPANRQESESIASPSANYNKTREFLPGERVVTPSGKEMNVWSADSIRPAIEATRAANPGQAEIPGGVIVDTRGGGPEFDRPAFDATAPQPPLPSRNPR